MNIPKFCIRHKVTTLMAFIMITVFGVAFTGQLQMSLLPAVEAPAAVVICYYNGANPSDMEQLVTRPLESAVMSVSGVESVSSSSSDGVSQLQVTYVDGTDLDIAATKLREKFDMLSLPDGAMDPMILNINISDLLPTAVIGLKGDSLTQVQALAEDTVVPALERVEGVAQVTVSGGVEQQIAVEVDSARAAGYGLSNSYIAQMLTAENLLYPAGDVQYGSQTLTVSTNAKFRSVDDVADMILPLPTGGRVRLNEVANVQLENADPSAIAKVDGTPCVILQVTKQSGGNEVATSKAVVKALEQLQQKNSAVQYTVAYLASDYINMAVNSALNNIFLGVLLAAVVLWFVCVTDVITSDKVVYLFGRIIPALSLLLSMTLRFVPQFTRRLRTVAQAQRRLGRDAGRGSVRQRVRSALRVFSIVVTWSLESGLIAADSMRGRGYGLPGRTAFALYRLDRRDAAMLLWLGFCGLYLLGGALAGGLAFQYYPLLSAGAVTPLTVSFFAVYGLLCFTPALVDGASRRLYLTRKGGDHHA